MAQTNEVEIKKLIANWPIKNIFYVLKTAVILAVKNLINSHNMLLRKNICLRDLEDSPKKSNLRILIARTDSDFFPKIVETFSEIIFSRVKDL